MFLIEFFVTRLWFICQMRARMEARRRGDDESVNDGSRLDR